MKVLELAKDVGVSDEELIEILQDIDIVVDGAEAELSDDQIAQVCDELGYASIEEAIADLEGIAKTESTALEGVANITVELEDGYDPRDLLDDIKATLARNEQVLIIYPLVEESEEVPYQSLEEARGYWEERFEGVYVTHGKDKEKEEVLLT